MACASSSAASKNDVPSVDLEDLPLVPGAEEERAVGSGHQSPDERRGRFVDQLGRWTKQQLSAAVDRQVLDVAFEKVGLCGRLEKFR
jgi:hypothetical protein